MHGKGNISRQSAPQPCCTAPRILSIKLPVMGFMLAAQTCAKQLAVCESIFRCVTQSTIILLDIAQLC